MKKNILLVHSFLALPLLTTSFVFSMNIEKPTYAQTTEKGTSLPQLPKKPSLKESGAQKRERRKERKRQQQELPRQTTAAEKNKKQESLAKDTVRYFSTEDQEQAEYELSQAKYNQTQELQEINSVIRALIDADKGLTHVNTVVKSMLTTYYNPENNALAQSTLGVEAKSLGFGVLGTITNAFKTNAQTILGLFKSKAFDINNQDHLTLLDKAIIECTDSNDIQSLLVIAETCEKKYPSIRFSHTDLLFQSLKEKYTTQIKTSQWILSNFDQEYAAAFNKQSAALKEQIMNLANAHKAMTTQLAQSYQTKVSEEQQKINDLQKLIVSTSALLDRHNSLKKVTLFTQNPLHIPASSVEGVKNETEKRLSSLITNSNLPLIQSTQTSK